MDTLGSRLRWLRKKKKLTQEDVADILNIDRSNFPAYENDKRSLDPAYISILAEYFGVDENWLKNGNLIQTPELKKPKEENQNAIIEELKATYEQMIALKDGLIEELRQDKRFLQEQLSKPLAA